MVALAAIGREEALRITRVVEPDEAMTGGLMRPMAGSTLVELRGLADVERFLVPTTAEELAELGVQAQIHHIDPRILASWVRDTIGDAELAASLDAVVDSERPFGLLVPEIKALLAERLTQCEAILAND